MCDILGDPISNPNIRRWITSGQQIMIKIQNHGCFPESEVFFRILIEFWRKFSEQITLQLDMFD